MVHGQRGAVVGAVATMGVVVGADVPMFLGAMVMGPAAAYLVKLFDKLIEDKIRPGFEMLVDNFSAGIIGGLMALVGVWAVGPAVSWIADRAEDGVDFLIDNHMLGLVSIIVEPAKVLFLNNAINHGVFTPLGVQQVAENGKSIMFMIESNPGPGLGLLLAFFLFGPRALRPSVPAAMIIQFLGGIHEIYFPYVLMKPRLILAMIAGGAAGVSTFMVTGAGLVSAPAPGSIFAYLAVTPKGGWFGVLLGIVIATAVTFVVASALLGFGRNEPAEEEEAAETEAELEAARARTAENKAASKNQTPATVNREATPREA
jgi:PTS system mannitol-specific IIC component